MRGTLTLQGQCSDMEGHAALVFRWNNLDCFLKIEICAPNKSNSHQICEQIW